jgi:hypothetical protein
MIAAAGFHRLRLGDVSALSLGADPSLALEFA